MPKKPKVFASITIAGKKLDLCRLEHSARLSRETYAYAAEVWVDGDFLCRAHNAGRGGCDIYEPVGMHTLPDVWAFSKWCTENQPVLKGQVDLKQDLELTIGELITNWLAGRALDKLLRSNTIYEPGEGIFDFKGSYPPGPARDVFKASVRQRYPKAVFLEDLPREEALQLLRKSKF